MFLRRRSLGTTEPQFPRRRRRAAAARSGRQPHPRYLTILDPASPWCRMFIPDSCAITGQPDFVPIWSSAYVPAKWMVESKSLKLYRRHFRNHGAFHEDCTDRHPARSWLRSAAGRSGCASGGYWYRAAACRSMCSGKPQAAGGLWDAGQDLSLTALTRRWPEFPATVARKPSWPAPDRFSPYSTPPMIAHGRP